MACTFVSAFAHCGSRSKIIVSEIVSHEMRTTTRYLMHSAPFVRTPHSLRQTVSHMAGVRRVGVNAALDGNVSKQDALMAASRASGRAIAFGMLWKMLWCEPFPMYVE